MSFNVRKFRFTRKEELLAVQLIVLCQFLGMSRARSRHRAFALFHERPDVEVLWALKSAWRISPTFASVAGPTTRRPVTRSKRLAISPAPGSGTRGRPRSRLLSGC